MSHVIVVLSGLADDPVEELDGQTPLAAAATPALDQLAAFAEVGLLRLLPEQDDDHPAIGVDLTSLAMLGYEPVTSGRGAVELLGVGAELGRRDVGLRLDLISTGAGVDPFPEALTAQEAETLWPDLERLSRPGITIRQASAMKALALWEEGPVEVGANPPGELDPARPLDEQMPEGEQEQAIRRLIDDAREMLAEHPLNRRRRDEQRPTLDALWPWGFGRAPELPMFVFRTGQVATLLAANLAARGAARAAGVSARRPAPGVYGPAELARAVVSALDHAPTVVAVASEADRAAHRGDAEAKRRAIEHLDRDLIAPLLGRLSDDRGLRLSVLSDFATLCATRRHAARGVPYCSYRPGRSVSGPGRFSEAEAAETGRVRSGATDMRGWLWSD